METGNSTKPTLEKKRRRAAMGSPSVTRMSAITRSPTYLVQRLKAGSGKGDHVTLSKQYRKYISTGTLALRRAFVLFLRRNTTIRPAANIAPKIAASMGLPSTVEARAPADPPPPRPSHKETGLDPAIESQMTGNHRALELRVDLSRSRKNSPAIPATQIRKAVQNIIRASHACLLTPI